MYKQGTFGLITSFKDPAGGLVTQLCGVGKAPALDGEAGRRLHPAHEAGAQILWESMQTPTPDISFTFEMQMEGFRPPARAILEADFRPDLFAQELCRGAGQHAPGRGDRAGLRRPAPHGGIKLTEIGDNADLHTLISTAYNKISQIMFETAPDILKPAAGLGPGQLGIGDSMLDKGEQVPGRQPGRQRQKRGGQRRRRRTPPFASAKARRCEARRRCPEGRSRGRQAGSRRQGAESGRLRKRGPSPAPKPDAPKPDAPKPDAPKPDAPKPDATSDAKIAASKLPQKEDEASGLARSRRPSGGCEEGQGQSRRARGLGDEGRRHEGRRQERQERRPTGLGGHRVLQDEEHPPERKDEVRPQQVHREPDHAAFRRQRRRRAAIQGPLPGGQPVEPPSISSARWSCTWTAPTSAISASTSTS